MEWPIIIFLSATHLLALGLCWAFPSWQGVLLAITLYVITGLGVTIGYHRKITHRAFHTPQWVENALAILGLLSGEGPPVFWTAIHRQHHKFSDQPGDPHSPHDGFWWAHWMWMTPKLDRRALGLLYSTYAPDLLRNRFYMRLERTYFHWHAGFAVALFLAGFAMGSWRMAMSFLGYGYFLRIVVVLHATWLVNSVSHRWGSRRYETADDSRNNALVAILAHGEGWHNNHHRVQAAANHGHQWWEFDLSFYAIVAAAVVTRPFQLVTDIRVFSPGTARVSTWMKKSRLTQ
jgi:fatty-acid desaturase